jgi:hypothetical protein
LLSSTDGAVVVMTSRSVPSETRSELSFGPTVRRPTTW